eukprot:96979-Amphidinium_carterae.1
MNPLCKDKLSTKVDLQYKCNVQKRETNALRQRITIPVQVNKSNWKWYPSLAVLHTACLNFGSPGSYEAKEVYEPRWRQVLWKHPAKGTVEALVSLSKCIVGYGLVSTGSRPQLTPYDDKAKRTELNETTDITWHAQLLPLPMVWGASTGNHAQENEKQSVRCF